VSYENVSDHIHRNASLVPSTATVSLYRSGGVCFAECNSSGVSLPAGWNTVATVDEPYRPKHRYTAFGLYPMGTLRDTAINTDGTLAIYVAAGTNTDLRVKIMYLIDVDGL
jgi:hypothetical protein